MNNKKKDNTHGQFEDRRRRRRRKKKKAKRFTPTTKSKGLHDREKKTTLKYDLLFLYSIYNMSFQFFISFVFLLWEANKNSKTLPIKLIVFVICLFIFSFLNTYQHK